MPGGAKGVAFKSKFPNNAACTESDGFLLENQMRFRVKLYCSISLFHSDARNLVSKECKSVIRWFLKVRIARSVAL